MATLADHHSASEQERPDALARTGSEESLSLLDMLLLLAQHRRKVLGCTAVFTLAGLGLSLLMRPSYTARTVILPPQQSNSTAAGMMSELSSLGAMGGLAGGLGLKTPGDMYVGLFQSQTVEDALIEQFHLQQVYKARYLSVARKDLESHAKVTADAKSTLISIAVSDHDPKRAAAIANGYVDQYRRLSEHLAISEAAQRRLFFEQQLSDAKNKLANAEEAMVKTQQTTGLVSLDSQARALIESAATLRAQIAAKQVQIQGMQSYAAADNSGLVQAENELAGLREQQKKLGGTGAGDGDEESLIVPRGKVSTAGLAYVRGLRDVKYEETIFNILARQFEMAKLDEAREGAVVQVVDRATVPDRKSAPVRSLWTLGAMVLGFLVGASWAIADFALHAMERDPETHEKMLVLRSLTMPWRHVAVRGRS